jgi:hypothetical protein
MFQRITLILSILFVFALGGLAGWYFFAPKPTSTESAQVMLERVRTVMKLVTVEGNYTELYSHNDYSGFFTFFWDKKMLLRVTATVSAGYDLEKVKIEMDAAQKIVRIGPLPPPSILSVDHKIDYYDISEGVFTSFTPQDYTQISERAKELIRQKAEQNLLPIAQQQAHKTFDLMRAMLEGAGWKLELIQNTTLR